MSRFKSGDIVVKIKSDGAIPRGTELMVKETYPDYSFNADWGSTGYNCDDCNFELKEIYDTPLFHALGEPDVQKR